MAQIPSLSLEIPNSMYLSNGTRLGWLINPQQRLVEICR